VDDYLIETTLTMVLAFGAYLVAERLQFSGVLAVVAAGLISGNIGPRGMSPTTRIVLFNFWETVAFLANSLVFLMIGLQINLAALATAWRPVVAAIGAVLVARVVVVYGLSWITNHWVERVPRPWQHVLAWGGLRGAVSLALALSLPAALGPDRDLLRVMAFGVVLFTLLAQATTMRPLVRWLGIVTRSQGQAEYEASHARLTTLRAADARLDRLHAEGLMSSPTWEKLKPIVSQRAAAQAAAVREVLQTEPALEAEELDTGWREVLRAQRAALLDLRRDGMISEDVFEKLTAEVDGQLNEGFIGVPEDSVARTQFIEVTLAANSPAVGQRVVDLALPRTAVLVSIRRGEEVIIPRGDTQFQAGDVVTALCEREHAGAIKQILLAATSTP
jgi:CPA1 family monovalent cation:H+ antiporter